MGRTKPTDFIEVLTNGPNSFLGSSTLIYSIPSIPFFLLENPWVFGKNGRTSSPDRWISSSQGAGIAPPIWPIRSSAFWRCAQTKPKRRASVSKSVRRRPEWIQNFTSKCWNFQPAKCLDFDVMSRGTQPAKSAVNPSAIPIWAGGMGMVQKAANEN